MLLRYSSLLGHYKLHYATNISEYQLSRIAFHIFIDSVKSLSLQGLKVNRHMACGFCNIRLKLQDPIVTCGTNLLPRASAL